MFLFLARFGLVAMAALAVGSCSSTGRSASSGAPNILFICVDDLRLQLGAYGRTVMVTPHLVHMGSQGRLFLRHYVQVPT